MRWLESAKLDTAHEVGNHVLAGRLWFLGGVLCFSLTAVLWNLGLAGFSIISFFAGIGAFINARGRTFFKKTAEAKLEDLEFEIDLLRFPVKPFETRAEKTLLQHNKQLRRYYAQNLAENEKVFWVGIGCIVLGMGIIGLTIYGIFQLSGENLETKIIVAVLGAVGSLLTNYIAAIYLKMHAAATNNLEKFHGRLVETHQVLFANLVASRIADDKIRWKSFSEVAVNLSKLAKPESKEKASSEHDHNRSERSDHPSSRRGEEEESSE